MYMRYVGITFGLDKYQDLWEQVGLRGKLVLVGGKGDLVAATGLLVALSTSAIGVTVLHPVVVHVVKVVKVLLLGTGAAEDIAGVHAYEPAIVFTGGLEKVSIMAVEDGLEIASADAQVGFGVPAVTFTLVGSDLHQADLTSTSLSTGVAR